MAFFCIVLPPATKARVFVAILRGTSRTISACPIQAKCGEVSSRSRRWLRAMRHRWASNLYRVTFHASVNGKLLGRVGDGWRAVAQVVDAADDIG
jgi:hypothetical protein